jgi:predicted secreted hydrolase
MRRLLIGFILAVAGLGALVWWLGDQDGPAAPPPAATVTSLLGDGDDSGFRRAVKPGGIELPRDHGAHDDYRSEWWYFTGNLATAAGREFGFQLTFFRFALGPSQSQRSSAWATNQIYMAHFAVTDIDADEHRVAERFARAAAGLAGVEARPFLAWLDDWSATSNGEAFLPLRLHAADPATGIELELELAPGKPAVRQGDRGLSAKGAAPGNASWYYSYTRLPAAGAITVDGEPHTVRGEAWLDREWGTSSLDAGVVGWDWFSLQLADGRDLMLYALRQANGGIAPQSAGSLIEADGSRQRLDRDDFILTPLDRWRSPATGVTWPVEWRVSIPEQGLDLEVRAAVADQEQDLTVRYWEGTVNVHAAAGGPRVGRGYLELTGYPPPANSAR